MFSAVVITVVITGDILVLIQILKRKFSFLLYLAVGLLHIIFLSIYLIN